MDRTEDNVKEETVWGERECPLGISSLGIWLIGVVPFLQDCSNRMGDAENILFKNVKLQYNTRQSQSILRFGRSFDFSIV